MIRDNQSQKCSFKDELISYVFTEMDEQSRPRFDQHLATCASCKDDLASFSNTRNQLTAWRDDEFASLESNVIVSPERISDSLNSITSIFGRAVSFVSISPGRLAFASLILLLMFGVGFLFLQSRNMNEERAANSQEPSAVQSANQIVSPKSTVSPAVLAESKTQNPVTGSGDISSKKIGAAVQYVSSSSRTGMRNSRSSAKSGTIRQMENPVAARAAKSRQQDIPQMNFDTELDEGVRLSDILDEVSMR